MDEKIIHSINSSYSDLQFINTDIKFEKDPIKRISSKTILWSRAVNDSPRRNIVLLDCDILVRTSLSKYFQNNFDIGFTYKNEQFPLNTGVMLIKKNPSSLKFFEKWKQDTLKIIKDDAMREKASSVDYPYGGPDQMSFYKILNYKKDKTDYEIQIDDKNLSLVGFPCRFLNETNSVPLNDKIDVIHYKGGWQPILMKGARFSKYRSFKNGKEMYLLYLKTFRDGFERLLKNDNKIKMAQLNIFFPNYIDKNTFELKKINFYFFIFLSNIKALPHVVLNTVSILKRKLVNLI